MARHQLPSGCGPMDPQGAGPSAGVAKSGTLERQQCSVTVLMITFILCQAGHNLTLVKASD